MSRNLDEPGPDLYDEKYYINRELSWLEFNRRCLEQAEDASNPVLERVKFIAICCGNMDEFFMIRVPGIISKTPIPGPDYLGINRNLLLESISKTVQELVNRYAKCWDDIRQALADAGIRIAKVDDLVTDQMAWVSWFYRERIHPLLTPLALDVSHPFPFISNNSLNIAVKLSDPKGQHYARVKVPVGVLPRFIEVPSSKGTTLVMLEDIIESHISSLFPDREIEGAYTFRVTRNADVKVTIDEACDFMTSVEDAIEDRGVGFPVRMVAEKTMPDDMARLFAKNLKLSEIQVHKSEFVMLVDLWEIAGMNYPKLKDKTFEPYVPPELAEGTDIFAAIRQKDWILFHPYESFGTIVRFVAQAAEDPTVQSIKICLYRIGKDPSLVRALIRARENGKTVSVLMELRAKFDETNNIRWAKELEKIGVHVVFGPLDLKVHSKLLQVVRLEGSRLVRYTHMSSGNYNTSTAKQYGDISFLTANQEIGEDVGELFNALTGFFGPRMYKHLLVAPLTLKDSLIAKIDREISVHKEKGNGYIAMKANGLIDSDIIASLYKASIAGVKIDLNIRGLCCLRPGIPGISENIRVTSIVDRFLEHSRIYYFENGGDPEMYMGSSDMMPRNLLARVEVLFPVLDKDMLAMIRDCILKVHLADNVKAKKLLSDGSYVPVGREEGEKKLRSQEWFIKHRGSWHGSAER
jgi:polyphosphate kinase